MKNKKKTCLGIILAKSNSRRIKNKNFIKINNKMMFQFVLDEAIKSNIFFKIYISTESKKKLEKINHFKKKVFYKSKLDTSYTRSKKLAYDKTPMLKVIKEIYKKFKVDFPSIKYICMIYATACLIKKNDFLKAFSRFKKICKKYRNKGVSMQTIASYPVPLEFAIKVKNDNQIKYLNKKSLKSTSDNFSKLYYDSGGFHFLNSNYFHNKKKIYFGYKIPKKRSVDINDLEDLDLAKGLLTKN